MRFKTCWFNGFYYHHKTSTKNNCVEFVKTHTQRRFHETMTLSKREDTSWKTPRFTAKCAKPTRQRLTRTTTFLLFALLVISTRSPLKTFRLKCWWRFASKIKHRVALVFPFALSLRTAKKWRWSTWAQRSFAALIFSMLNAQAINTTKAKTRKKWLPNRCSVRRGKRIAYRSQWRATLKATAKPINTSTKAPRFATRKRLQTSHTRHSLVPHQGSVKISWSQLYKGWLHNPENIIC